MQPITPRQSIKSFDAVSGLSFCGGIPRMDDGIDLDLPSPKTVERRKRRSDGYAKFQSDAATAAKNMRQRLQYATTVYYIPATHPSFTKYIQSRNDAIAKAVPNENSEPYDVSHDQLATFVKNLQSLRIRLIVDPVPPTIDELRALSAETSRNEALAYATAYAEPPRDTFSADVAAYLFVKETRINLENEIRRCQKRSLNFAAPIPTPTPHARIATSTSPRLGIIFSLDTLNRTFISIPALMVAVCNDIEKFITCPTRAGERIAFVAQGDLPQTN